MTDDVSDDDAFVRFVDARWGQLVRSGVLLGCSEPEAQDLAQSTLTRCYQAWSKVEQARDRDAYVFRILINTLAKSRKRRWWGEVPVEELPEVRSADDPASVVATRSAVQQALAKLSIDHRAVLVLRFFADLSEQQTAEVLGVATGTVKSRTARALEQLSLDTTLNELLQS